MNEPQYVRDLPLVACDRIDTRRTLRRRDGGKCGRPIRDIAIVAGLTALSPLVLCLFPVVLLWPHHRGRWGSRP